MNTSSSHAAAQPEQRLRDYLDRARHDQLASSEQWFSLVHYRPNHLRPGVTSFVTDPRFFLAARGNTDPAAELTATILALFQPLGTIAPDQHAQCRFIARFHWLQSALAIQAGDLPTIPCGEYARWYNTIHPASITLVFPAAYINNPSSMFGHTFLRVDPPPQAANTPLSSYSISYAAATTEFNGLIFAIKGLSGGYPGYFSIQPYYEKVNEYNDLENRDVWEYSLNFTAAEVQRVMQHTWELHNVYFDYYFLDENCSFQLLGLLDVARPGMRLTADFPLGVIPADTVRSILRQPGLLKTTYYRPSSRSNLAYWLAALPEPQQDWIYDYTFNHATLTDPVFTALTPVQQAVVTDVGYANVQYQYRRRRLPRTQSAPKSLELLTYRSHLANNTVLAPVPVPVTRPDQGHLSSRVGIGAGLNAGHSFAQLQWRPAYHDVLDNDQGHVAGAQINFLALAVRFNSLNHTELEKLTFIDLLSITPTSRFFPALSWHFDTGFERVVIDSATQRRLAYTLNAGLGYTYGITTALRGYGFVDGGLVLHPAYSHDLAMGAGLRVGLLWQVQPQWKMQLQGRALDLSYHDQRVLQTWQLIQNISLDRDHALRLSWQRSGTKDQLQTETLLAWLYYF